MQQSPTQMNETVITPERDRLTDRQIDRKKDAGKKERKKRMLVHHPLCRVGRYPDASVGGDDTDAIDWVPVCY